MTKKERLQLARWAIQFALKQGADQASVFITRQRNIEIEHRDGQLDKIQESTQNSLNLTIYANHRYSGHSTSDLQKSSLEKFIRDAVSMTRYLSEDIYRELPDPALYKGRQEINLEINDPYYHQIDSVQRVNLAKEIEAISRTVSEKIISVTAGYNDTYFERVQINSNGFEGAVEGTFFSAGAETTVQGKDGERSEDWYYASTRHFKQLPNPAFLGKQAAERALKKIGQKKIASAKMSMLIENRAAGRLFYALRTPMTGRALQQKQSYLEGMLNQKIASDVLTVTDDPFIKKGLSSRLFDGEGITAKPLPIIEKGVLRNYFIDNYYGKKLGMVPTSGSSSNTVFELGKYSVEELTKKMQKGIFITSFIGGNSNSTTGDFSFGLQGFYIENGEIIQPVNEMNISGNMKDLWSQLTELGNDPYPYSSLKSPSLLFGEIQFSGL